MIQDALLQFSDAQALTATAVSTNVIDLFANANGQNSNIMDGTPMAVMIAPSVGADSTTGDETYAVSLQTDDNSGFSSPTTLGTMTFTAAQLKAGISPAYFGVPSGTYERYIRLNYTLGGTTPSMTIDAFLTPLSAIPKYSKYYKSGFEVL